MIHIFEVESICGNITIKGGNITARGGVSGAGIGGGADNASCYEITISGGEINAYGGSSMGAGIGAGKSSL